MKNITGIKIILLFTLSLLFKNITAQEATGYYITHNNDTVKAVYKLKKGYFNNTFTTYDLYKRLPVVNEENKKNNLKPSEIKGYYIEWEGEKALFTSLPIDNKTEYFWHAIVMSSRLNVYETVLNDDRTQFYLQKPDGDYMYIISDFGNITTKKLLKEFFKGEEGIDTALQKLFTRPGFTYTDMNIFLKRYFPEYKKQMSRETMILEKPHSPRMVF